MKRIIILLSIAFGFSVSAQNFTTSGVSFGDINSGLTINSNNSIAGGTSITQSTDTVTVTTPNSVACPADNDSYFRRFDVDTDHGISTTFNVTGVDFTTETATGNGGVQDIIVNLYSINNGSMLLLANLTPIGTATISVADGTATVQNVAITGTLNGATDDLVVEIVANDTLNATTYFIGSNANGQTAPSFLMSAGCGAPEPSDVATLGFPDMHIIMVVNGNVFVPPPAIIPSLSVIGLLMLIIGMYFVYYRRNRVLN